MLFKSYLKKTCVRILKKILLHYYCIVDLFTYGKCTEDNHGSSKLLLRGLHNLHWRVAQLRCTFKPYHFLQQSYSLCIYWLHIPTLTFSRRPSLEFYSRAEPNPYLNLSLQLKLKLLLLPLRLLLACGNYETAGSRRRLPLTLIKSLDACCAQTTDPTDTDKISDADARR